MSSRFSRSLGLFLLLLMGRWAAGAQETLSLRQAINAALGQNPEAALARAGVMDATAAVSRTRTMLLPQLGFTEDISRGNDPVYVFGTRLRQKQFTQADFALNALNSPQPIGNFSTRFSGQWLAFDSFKTQKEIRRAELSKQSASSSAQGRRPTDRVPRCGGLPASSVCAARGRSGPARAGDCGGAAQFGGRTREGRSCGRV